jgi:hypothetical protein
MTTTMHNQDDLAHAISKIIKADQEVVQELEDGIVKEEILSIRRDTQ